MKYLFHPEALAEFDEAARYFSEIQPGLGLRFVANVESAIARIVESPRFFRVFDGEVRRCLTHVFPYAVLCGIDPEQVVIVAVMHCRREPGYRRSRVPSHS